MAGQETAIVVTMGTHTIIPPFKWRQQPPDPNAGTPAARIASTDSRMVHPDVT
jgi:hypothetical protein